MKVAYVFSTPNASFILEKMIIPQLEEGRHGAEGIHRAYLTGFVNDE